MTSVSFRFASFVLDPADRQLRDGEIAVELNGRYLDALALLVSESGKLVSKDRFLEEVWRGVPVTDEALTQCIRTLRRQLGDDAARPRFIETVPKHGYRFIAVVERVEAAERLKLEFRAEAPAHPAWSWRAFLLLGGAGTVGAGAAGLVGGLAYGFAGAAQPAASGVGAASVLLVILWLTIAAAVTGGVGVSFGIAAASFARSRVWRVAGGAAGGMIVGGIVKLLGLDAFHLLLGRSPGDVSGAGEGILLGGAVGVGAWLDGRVGIGSSLKRALAFAAIAGGTGGFAIALLGGQLMAGSLDVLAQAFPGSRLRLDTLGALLGETSFDSTSRIVTATLEGAAFGTGIVGAMALARRSLQGRGEQGSDPDRHHT